MVMWACISQLLWDAAGRVDTHGRMLIGIYIHVVLEMNSESELWRQARLLQIRLCGFILGGWME